jgi:polyisoprenoid-binding protein YceI
VKLHGWLLAAALLPSEAAEAPWQLALEPNHSSFGFSVEIAGGLTRVTGGFKEADLRIRWDPEAIDRCSVEATIRAAGVDTRNDMRDADLRGPKFFDVANHPDITFRSRRIEKRGDAYVAIGQLSIRGVSRQVELPFAVTGIEWHEGRPLLGVRIRWTIDRLDYGVGADWRHTAIPNFLGKEVTIEIDVWTKLGRKEVEPAP